MKGNLLQGSQSGFQEIFDRILIGNESNLVCGSPDRFPSDLETQNKLCSGSLEQILIDAQSNSI